LGFPWPPKRGWAKRCSTLPWPLSGWALQVLFFLLTRRSHAKGAGVKAGTQRRWGARRAGLDAGASAAYLASPPSRKTAAASRRPGEWLPSCAHPRRFPGHGKPSTASRSAAHSPASERPLDLPWERSDWRGVGGHAAPALPASPRLRRVRHACTSSVPQYAQGHRPGPARPEARLIHPPALASGQTSIAVLLVRVARLGLDAGAPRHFMPNACKGEERSQRASDRSGTAADLQEREAIRRAPGGVWG